jgi:hypothetical protein
MKLSPSVDKNTHILNYMFVFGLILLGGISGFLLKRFFFKKVVNLARKHKKNRKKKLKKFSIDDLDGWGLLVIGAIALGLAIWLIVIIVRTFWIWFPIFLGILGVALVIMMVSEILRAKNESPYGLELDDFELWFQLLVGAILLGLAIWLVVIMVRTFWIWFPILLGLLGVFMAYWMVQKILQIRSDKMRYD